MDRLPLDLVRSLAARAWLYPGAVLGAAAGAALLVAAVLFYLRRRHPRVARQVRSLARHGHPPAAIARRTGLSRDAVALALKVGAERRILPAPARIAGNLGAPVSFDEAMQVAASNPLESLPEEWSRPARALPPRRARILRFRNRTTAWASSTE